MTTVACSPAAIRAIRTARADGLCLHFVPAADGERAYHLVAIAYDADGGEWPRAIFADGSTSSLADRHLHLLPNSAADLFSART